MSPRPLQLLQLPLLAAAGRAGHAPKRLGLRERGRGGARGGKEEEASGGRGSSGSQRPGPKGSRRASASWPRRQGRPPQPTCRGPASTGGGDPGAERSPGEEGWRGHARSGGRGFSDPKELSPHHPRELCGDGRETPGPGAAHTRGARQAGRAAPRVRGIALTELREAQTPGADRPRRPLGSRCSAQPRGRSGPGSGSGSHPPSSPPPPGRPAARGRAGGGAWLYISPHTLPGRAQRPEPRRLPAPLPALRGGGGSGSSSSNMAVDGCSGWRWRREELPRAPAPAAHC